MAGEACRLLGRQAGKIHQTVRIDFMKKWVSALLALVLLVTLCAGCGEQEEPPSGIYYDITGIAPDEAVMTVDGSDVPAELYFYWNTYNCGALEYQLSMYYAYYGLYADYINEDGSAKWEEPFMGEQTLGEYARELAENTVKFYASIENLAKEQGVVLTEEDKAALEENYAAAVEQLGSEEAFEQQLDQIGLSRESFDRLSSFNFLFDGLKELVLQEGSPLYLEPVDYNEYAAYADHILLATMDPTSGQVLSEEEIAAKRQTAEELLSQLQASEDTETLFAQLADEYSEDPGRSTYPDGYVFASGEMDTAFETAAMALEPGQISDIVESSYGYHIILRKDLLEKLEADPEEKAALAEEHLSSVLNLMVENAEVTRSEKLDAVDPNTFYPSYLTRLDELFPAEDSDTSAEDDAGASSDTGDNAAGGQ